MTMGVTADIQGSLQRPRFCSGQGGQPGVCEASSTGQGPLSCCACRACFRASSATTPPLLPLPQCCGTGGLAASAALSAACGGGVCARRAGRCLTRVVDRVWGLCAWRAKCSGEVRQACSWHRQAVATLVHRRHHLVCSCRFRV